MYRWLLLAGLWGLVLALGALFWLGWYAVRHGVPLRLAELPIQVEVGNPLLLATPLEVHVSSLPFEFPERLGVVVEGAVRAETGLLRCPVCREGIQLPLRWNLFSGEITWGCSACGAVFAP